MAESPGESRVWKEPSNAFSQLKCRANRVGLAGVEKVQGLAEKASYVFPTKSVV
jgi:hypothetical protein